MSQTTITGRIVNAQQLFTSSNGNFRKQTLILEVVNGSYTSYLPIELHNADIDNIMPTIQQNGTYTVTAYVQGSNQQMTDKNGQPTAYVSLKATSVVPAQGGGLPQTTPATAPNTFQGGFVGQPAQPAAPAVNPNQGFGNPAPAAPAPNFGGGNANPAPAQGGGFTAPAQSNSPFGTPQQWATDGQQFKTGEQVAEELQQQYATQAEYVEAREKVIADEQAAAYSVEETQAMLDGEDPDADNI